MSARTIANIMVSIALLCVVLFTNGIFLKTIESGMIRLMLSSLVGSMATMALLDTWGKLK